jgi:DUF1365 family protein
MALEPARLSDADHDGMRSPSSQNNGLIASPQSSQARDGMLQSPPLQSASLQSAIFTGWVRHRRSVPRKHAFRYRMFMLYLDLAEIERVFSGRWLWSTHRRNVAEFRRSDYHGDPAVPLDTAIRDTVALRLGIRPVGPIRMLAHLRYFGHCFNPVVFYYGYAADGTTLDWILAEISNIPWNERHAYVLPLSSATTHGTTHGWKFRKEFTVSPFMPLERGYDWRFQEPCEQLRVHMDVLAGHHIEMDTTLVLERRTLDGPGLARALLHFPVMSARVVMAIYWQAFRLWLKGVPFHGHGKRRQASP